LLTLTGREREILNHVIAGKTSKEMGADLGVSPRTIEVHRGRVMTKLAVDSVAVLVRRYVQAGGALAGAA
jgi:two-component system response regulator FixJ